MNEARQVESTASSGRLGVLGRVALAVLYSALVAAVGLVLDARDIAIVDTLDKLVGDYRIAWGSPRAPAQRADIAVVLVTEDTLLNYESRSPIDRGLIAELVRAIDKAGPKAIGLDLIFDRRTSQDEKLLTAIREAKAPIVLGAIDERVPAPRRSLAIQDELLRAAGRPYGHLLLERKVGLLATGDSTVRLVADTYPGPPQREAFAAVLARAAGAVQQPGNRIISWQRPPHPDGTPLFAALAVPQHAPADRRPALEGLFPDSWRELLKDRIVLVGATMVDRDQHTTPLSVIDGEAMPGVMIHAQALAQRLDGNRDILMWPLWLTFLTVTGTALACLLAARRLWLKPHGLAYQWLGLLLIGLASFLAFQYFRIDLPSTALATAWAGGAFGGFYGGWFCRRLGLEV